MSDLQFHMRNFDSSESWFSTYHAGCGGTPWSDGRPKCWAKTVPTNPTGGQDSVYVPSDWVTDIGTWMQVIADSLKLVTDISVFIASEGENAKSAVSTIKDALKIEEDIENRIPVFSASEFSQSLANAAASVHTSEDTIRNIAREMGLGESGWMFVGGAAYDKQVFQGSGINGGHGWTVLANPHNEHQKVWKNLHSNHCFIHQGSMVFAWNSELYLNYLNQMQGKPVNGPTANLWYHR